MKQNTNQSKNNFYDKYHEKNDNFFKIIKENNFTYYYIQQALSYIFSNLSNAKVLDIGCGVGTLGFYLSNRGFSVDGYDVSARAISIANNYKKVGKINNIRFFNHDVMSEDFDSKYDLVICTEVIEHLENDKKMLSTIHNSLRKNGYLLLSTPSKNAPLYRLGFLKAFDKEVGHLRRYSSDELSKLLHKAGFNIEKSYRVEGIIRNALFTIPLIGNVIRFIRGPIVPIFHMMDSASSKIFGESDIIIVARKS